MSSAGESGKIVTLGAEPIVVRNDEEDLDEDDEEEDELDGVEELGLDAE